MDIRPHPHIGLATVTYLFSGEVMHRDSLGYEQVIRPQEVNWMTAGRGITHSERCRRRGAHPAAGGAEAASASRVMSKDIHLTVDTHGKRSQARHA